MNEPRFKTLEVDFLGKNQTIYSEKSIICVFDFKLEYLCNKDLKGWSVFLGADDYLTPTMTVLFHGPPTRGPVMYFCESTQEEEEEGGGR